VRIIYRWYSVYNKNQQLINPKEPEVKLKKIPSPKFKLMVGGTYLILGKNESELEEGFRIFRDIMRNGSPGLVVTRTMPRKVLNRYRLGELNTIWLSRSIDKNAIKPTNLGKLVDEIKEFTSRNSNTIVMFDGLEYLIVQNDFGRVLKFLQSLKDEITIQNARLIMTLNPNTLGKNKVELLKNELKVLNIHN
jgi:two-component system cell cycle response regulator